MALEITTSCMHCKQSIRVCIPTDGPLPPTAVSIYEAECPLCNKMTNFSPVAGTYRDKCDGAIPIARVVIR